MLPKQPKKKTAPAARAVVYHIGRKQQRRRLSVSDAVPACADESVARLVRARTLPLHWRAVHLSRTNPRTGHRLLQGGKQPSLPAGVLPRRPASCGEQHLLFESIRFFS